MIDHTLLETLEYKGEYGARYRCFQCLHYNKDAYHKKGVCRKLNNDRISVNENNNICKRYEARIKNHSSPIFVFDDYLEFLMSDYYRPYSIDSSIITGYIDRPSFYTHDKRTKIPIYKYYDKPYCRLINPLTVVSFDRYNFELDYKLFRENQWITDGVIKYKKCYFKGKVSSRKYEVTYNGIFDLKTEEFI